MASLSPAAGSPPGVARATALSRAGALRWGILVAALSLFAVHAWFYRFFTVDDTYITFRFVRQWLAGNGLVFNIGERVEGYSNFLWIVVLAALNALGIDLPTAAKAAGFGLSLITLIVLWQLARQAGRPPLAALFLAASAPFVAWSMGGLETSLVTCLVVVSAYAFTQEQSHGRGLTSGLWFGLLALARPEALLYAGVAGLLRLWDLRRSRTRPTRQDWLRLAIFFAIVLTYHTWRMAYYGYPLPNTVYAKSMGGHLRGYVEGVYYLYTSLVAIGGPALLALTAAFVIARPQRDGAIRYALAASAAQGLFLVVAGGDWMPLNRFAVHVLPLVYLVAEAGLVQMAALWQSARGLLITAVVVTQVGFLLMHSAEIIWIDRLVSPAVQAAGEPVPLPSRLTAPDATIAVVDAGGLPNRLPLSTRVIDMVGLVDAHIAHLPPQFPGGLFSSGDGFGKWDPDYVLAQKPDYIQFHIIGRTPDGHLLTDFTGTTLLARQPDFLRHYRLAEESGIPGLFERIE